MMMTRALASFYGGMVRKKNILSTLNLSWMIIGLVSAQWVLLGYTLAFGPSLGGGLTNSGLVGVSDAPNPQYALTIPQLAFAAY